MEAELSNVTYFPRLVNATDESIRPFCARRDPGHRDGGHRIMEDDYPDRRDAGFLHIPAPLPAPVVQPGRSTADRGLSVDAEPSTEVEPAVPDDLDPNADARPLPASLALLNRPYQELSIQVDPDARALWCRLCPDGPPSFTPSMLRELNMLHHDIRSLFASTSKEEQPPLLYYVQGSKIPGIYNMGGDFAFMKDCVARADRDSLKRYAFDCVESVHRILTGFNSPIVSIALIQGDALGGGFEGALCCNVIVAERSSRMGFPEILFNTFPGMGAYSIISRRLSPAVAERLIMSGKVHTAEEMYEMGLVDVIAEDGEGETAVRDFMKAGESRHRVRKAMFDVRQRVNPVTLDELHDVTELWTDHVLKLAPSDLRRMSHLQAAQIRRLSRLQKSVEAQR
jgi:DSF synthase